MESLKDAITQMNNLPDISGQDSETLQYFSRTTAKELKVGGVTAGTSIQMIGYIRSLEMQLRGQSQWLPDDAFCPKCGERAEWKDCESCGGDGGQYYCSLCRQQYSLPPVLIREITDERRRQDAQWGGPSHDDTHIWLDWRDFIQIQLNKALSSTARERCIKIAALAIAAIESLERRAASEDV